ncbi:hypothetical protein NECAME_05836 [Necator americanus]|uniref:Uncharacterized protein n=1 Tax=Necator americanus TaxID=51031 RepID=W2TY19_NECAM|nr:hypothetical protein NECAME_05836 [Necator americanus]ETN86748.1 hypothetical protein NECAME_05836 [Necator americanus]
MGIQLHVREEGRMQLSHHSTNDQVVKCEIDGNGVPPTSSAVRLANSNVAFGQMGFPRISIDVDVAKNEYYGRFFVLFVLLTRAAESPIFASVECAQK